MCGSGISQTFEQTFSHRIWGFLLSKTPTLLSSSCGCSELCPLFFRPERLWVFYWNFIHPAQCQFWPAHRLKVIKNRWPFPFVPESSAVQNPHYFCSLSGTFRVFCLFWFGFGLEFIVVIYRRVGSGRSDNFFLRSKERWTLSLAYHPVLHISSVSPKQFLKVLAHRIPWSIDLSLSLALVNNIGVKPY